MQQQGAEVLWCVSQFENIVTVMLAARILRGCAVVRHTLSVSAHHTDEVRGVQALPATASHQLKDI